MKKKLSKRQTKKQAKLLAGKMGWKQYKPIWYKIGFIHQKMGEIRCGSTWSDFYRVFLAEYTYREYFWR